MSTIDTARARLQELVDELERELTAIRSALVALGVQVDAPPSSPPPLELHRCDQCDDAFSTKQGLTMHRTRRHRPATPPPATTTITYTVDPDELCLRCDSCEFATPTGPIKPLLDHVMREHQRQPTAAERRPRKADG